MTNESRILWAVRVSWPLLGGVWGACAGFGGFHGITQNPDSFGSFFAQGFFIATAFIGLCAGIVCGMVVGGLTEKLLHRCDIRPVSAVCVATAVNALVIWQLVGVVQARYPGFRAPATVTDAVVPHEKPMADKVRPENPCSQPPPLNSKDRAGWEAECR